MTDLESLPLVLDLAVYHNGRCQRKRCELSLCRLAGRWVIFHSEISKHDKLNERINQYLTLSCERCHSLGILTWLTKFKLTQLDDSDVICISSAVID